MYVCTNWCCRMILGLGYVFPPSRMWALSPFTSHRQTQILVQYHCQVIIWDRAAPNYSKDTPHVWNKRKKLSHSAGVTEPSNVQIKNCNSFFFKIVLPGLFDTDAGTV